MLKKLSVAFCVASLLGGVALADTTSTVGTGKQSVQITFTGSILAPSCQFSVDDHTAAGVIPLGAIKAAVNAQSEPKQISLKISGCHNGGSVKVSPGASQTYNANMLDVVSLDATNVKIGFYDNVRCDPAADAWRLGGEALEIAAADPEHQQTDPAALTSSKNAYVRIHANQNALKGDFSELVVFELTYE